MLVVVVVSPHGVRSVHVARTTTMTYTLLLVSFPRLLVVMMMMTAGGFLGLTLTFVRGRNVATAARRSGFGCSDEAFIARNVFFIARIPARLSRVPA